MISGVAKFVSSMLGQYTVMCPIPEFSSLSRVSNRFAQFELPHAAAMVGLTLDPREFLQIRRSQQHAHISAHSWPHSYLRRLCALRSLRPLLERLPHLPSVESRSRFAPRPHPPDDQRRAKRAYQSCCACRAHHRFLCRAHR